MADFGYDARWLCLYQLQRREIRCRQRSRWTPGRRWRTRRRTPLYWNVRRPVRLTPRELSISTPICSAASRRSRFVSEFLCLTWLFLLRRFTFYVAVSLLSLSYSYIHALFAVLYIFSHPGGCGTLCFFRILHTGVQMRKDRL